MDPLEFIKLIIARIEELGEHEDIVDEEVAWEHEAALADIHQSCEAFLDHNYDHIVII